MHLITVATFKIKQVMTTKERGIKENVLESSKNADEKNESVIFAIMQLKKKRVNL